jgi:hypothetical protein
VAIVCWVRAGISRDPGDRTAGRADDIWRRRNFGPSLGYPRYARATTARDPHARHAASDYDERAIRAIAILCEIDERLLKKGGSRFMRPAAIFSKNSFFPAKAKETLPDVQVTRPGDAPLDRGRV